MEKKNSPSESKTFDWTKVLDIVIKILTIGLYHVEKHRSGSGTGKPQS